MDVIEIPGLPFPGHAAFGARAADPGEVRGAGRHSAGHSQHPRRSRHCRSSRSRSSAAATTPTSSGWPTRWATSSTSSRGRRRALQRPTGARRSASASRSRHSPSTWTRQTNVEQLSFNFDKERKKIPIVFFQEPFTKAPIGVPDPRCHAAQSAARAGAAAAAQDRQTRRHRPSLGPRGVDSAASPMPASTATRCSAPAASTSPSTAGCSSSRQLVGVRGAGLPFDGLYYVKSVTHEIERGSYKQSFSLARNALVSTFPTVPT